jgi:hypothetical protein
MRTDGGVTYNFLGVHPQQKVLGRFARTFLWNLASGAPPIQN